MEMYEVIVVELMSETKSTILVKVDEDETTEDFVIYARIYGQDITSSNYGYFSAFQQFRDKLLELGFGIKCSGALLNAVQSQMMETGDKIYLVEMGKKPQIKDIVSIWDYADMKSFPNTEEQTIFLKKWLK